MKAQRFVLMLLPLLIGCAESGTLRPGPGDVSVELDAFSGLPNPTWTLSPPEARELAKRLENLPRTDLSSGGDPTLGYRGFRIRNPGGEGGIPELMYVSREGLIEIESDGGRVRAFRDRRQAEAWLVASAERRGYGAVFQQ